MELENKLTQSKTYFYHLDSLYQLSLKARTNLSVFIRVSTAQVWISAQDKKQ